ncbi:MAG: hypothetical protein ABIG34_05620 [Candidatus Peregrinibacteria bacterium]
MHTPTPFLPEGSQPESVPLHTGLPEHGDVEQGRALARDQLAPFLSASNDAAQEREREQEEQEAAAKAATLRSETPVPVAAPDVLQISDVPASQKEAVSRESIVKGTAAAAFGTAAAASVLPAYGSTILSPVAATTVAGFMPSASMLGLTLGVPAAGGAAGYYLGKKLKHPVAGSLAGAAAGAATTMAVVPYVNLSTVAGMTGGAPSGLAALGAVQGAGVLSGLAMSAALPLGVGAGLYGLGRWHQRVRGSAPAGLLGTMAQGIIAPVSVPLGYIAKMRGKKAR